VEVVAGEDAEVEDKDGAFGESRGGAVENGGDYV
jgi:hypothetical protein